MSTSCRRAGTGLVRLAAVSVLAFCLLGAAVVQSQPAFDSVVNVVQWTAAEGGNGHWYALFKHRMPWTAADSAVATMEWGGLPVYLATVTSSSENTFVYQNVLQGPDTTVPADKQVYLGAEYEFDWAWLTGEPFDFSNWAVGEPNNLGIETGIAIRSAGGQWNNIYTLGSPGSVHQEWSVVEWGAPDSTFQPDSLFNVVQWPASEGGNDHWYAVFPERVSWETARTIAESFELDTLSGYLATVTSPEENQFILNYVLDSLDAIGSPGQLYLGGMYDEGDWLWVTDEAFEYSQWAAGEPNNVGTENAIAMRTSSGYWNNVIPNGAPGSVHLEWSIIEFGSVDTTSQELDSLIHLVQWPIAEGGNDHWYAVYPERVPWQTARQLAETFEHDTLTGYLATITSETENQFVFDHVLGGLDSLGSPFQLYLGGQYDFSEWQWLSGEGWDYENWALGEPNNLGLENAMAMRFTDGEWNNVVANGDPGSVHREWSVIEFGTPGTTPEPLDSLVHLVEWSETEGGNGHWYAVFPYREPWETAEAIAATFTLDTMSGYLATVNSLEENQFIYDAVLSGLDTLGSPWQLYLGGAHHLDQWYWLTNEPFIFTHWASGEPNNIGVETAMAMRFGDGFWNNVRPTDASGSIHREWSIIEFGTADTTVTPPDSLYNLVQWPEAEGGNGHWYAVFPERMPWETARDVVTSFVVDTMSGYLATVTSPEENQFIFNVLFDGLEVLGSPYQLYLGGTYENGAWQWLSGEAFSYSRWNSGEPNNTGIETALAMRFADGFWNNVMPNDATGSIHQEWSVVEFGTPDSTSQPTDSLINLVQWSAAVGGNDHWYAVLPHTVSWIDAYSLATTFSQGNDSGYLASVTSPEENQFILTQVIDGISQPGAVNQFYLGGAYISEWQWMTDEPFDYTNWASGEPTNVHVEKGLAMLASSGEWNNVVNNDYGDPIHRQWSVIEFGSVSAPPIDSIISLTQWPVSEGGNDHWYAVLAIVQPWVEARDAAEQIELLGVPGMLASITSQAENDFIRDNIIANLIPPTELDQFYLGGRFDDADLQWWWLSGEAFSYQNWADGEPSFSSFESALAMWGPTNTQPNRLPGTWNDVQPTDVGGSVHRQWAVVEWNPGEQAVMGNTNSDPQGAVDLADVLYLANALFLEGPSPSEPALCNVDGDPECNVDLKDLIYLVNALYLGGPEAASCYPHCVR
ncbi:hypothetical protein GF420_00335 [candidate division GN15 bacterium]|nr:hypothetical protein [candidate division GN15 bacterium]